MQAKSNLRTALNTALKTALKTAQNDTGWPHGTIILQFCHPSPRAGVKFCKRN